MSQKAKPGFQNGSSTPQPTVEARGAVSEPQIT